MKKNVPLVIIIFSLIYLIACNQGNKNTKVNGVIKDNNTSNCVVFKNWKLNVDELKLIDTLSKQNNFKVWDINLEPGVWKQKNYAKNPLFPVIKAQDTIGYLKKDNETIVLLDNKEKKIKWEYKIQYNYRDNIQSVFENDSIYIAIFSPIATGSTLICLNASTGKNNWIGDVKCLSICHSKYKNDVFIRKFGNKIVLAGDESGGILQVLDSRTGKNLFYVHDSTVNIINEGPIKSR